MSFFAPARASVPSASLHSHDERPLTAAASASPLASMMDRTWHHALWRERGREQCEWSPHGDHKGPNAVYSGSHWPSCFSMIRAARNGAMVAIEQAIFHV